MVSLAGTKAIVLVVLLILTFTLGVLPIKLIHIFQVRAQKKQQLTNNDEKQEEETERLPTYKRVISFLSCSAAGVFLATCFLDLMPDVQRQLTSVLDIYKIHTGFPVAEFIACLGLFGILITEQIVLTVKESHTVSPDIRKPLLSSKSDITESTQSDKSDHSMSGIHDHHRRRQILKRSEISDDNGDETHVVRPNYEKCEESENHSPLRALLLLLALSLHSIFEGLAVGLQQSTKGVLEIFAALVMHKGILSFSLGMNLVQTRMSEGAAIRSILIFSLTSPIGIAMGIGIMDFWDSTTSSLVQGILQGIASGTFLYITFFEVLPHEFNNSHNRLVKVLFLLLGFSAVTGILFLTDTVRKPLCAVTPTPGP